VACAVQRSGLPPGVSNRGLARMLARAPTRPAAAARGPNPNASLELVNKRGTKKVPSSVAEARKQAEA
jgi:hypothetical protein